MKPEIGVSLRADSEQFEKDLKNTKGEIEVDTKVNTAAIDAFQKKMLGVNRVTIPTRVDDDAIREAADIHKQVKEFLSDPINIRVETASQQHVNVLTEAMRQLRRESEILSKALEGKSWGKTEFRGATVAVSDLRKELNTTNWAIEEIQEAMRQMGEVPVAMDSQKGLQRALKDTGDEAQRTGKKIDASMNVSARATMGFSFNLKRLMASMIGMQSFYTLMNRASRQYMDSNRMIKASIMGVTDALGQMMAPAIHAAVKGLQTLIRWIMIALAYFKTFMNVVWGTNMQIQWVLHSSQAASGGLKGMGKSAKKAGKDMEKAFKKMLSPVDELNVITDDAKDSLGDLGDTDFGGGGAVDDFVAPDMTPFDITDKIDQVKRFGDFLERNKTLFQIISGILAAMVGKWALNKLAAGLFGGEISSLGTGFGLTNALMIAGLVLLGGAIYILITHWDEYEDQVMRIWEGLQELFTNVLELLLFLVESTLDTINSIWDKHGEDIMAIWTLILGVIEVIIDTIMEIVMIVIEKMQSWWDKYGDAVKVVWDLILKVAGWVLDAILLIVGSAMKLISGDFSFIGDIWSFVWNSIKSVAWGILQWLIGVVMQLPGQFLRVGEGIGRAFGRGWEIVKETFSKVWTWILGKLSKGGSIFHGFADGVASVFKSIVNVILRGVNSIVGSPFRKLNSMLNGFSSISILGARPFSFLGWNPIPVPHIPMFAKGYVGTQAQMGIFGEYTGARMNPEIVTPQNIMKETYREVHREEQGSQSGGDLYMTFHIDGKGKVTEVIKDYNQYKRNGGKLKFEI